MALNQQKGVEAEGKKPSLSESVDAIISKKRTEGKDEGASEVQRSAEGVQHEVSEIMAGVEAAKEGISERKEGKSGGDLKGGGQGAATQDPAQFSGIYGGQPLPNEEVMIKKVRTAIHLQIKVEWERAKRSHKKLSEGGAVEYTRSIARIRAMKKMLAGLWSATYEYLKGLYCKYFTPDGKQRPMDEIEVDMDA